MQALHRRLNHLLFRLSSCVCKSHAWAPTFAIHSRKALHFDVRRFYCEACNDRTWEGRYTAMQANCGDFGPITVLFFVLVWPSWGEFAVVQCFWTCFLITSLVGYNILHNFSRFEHCLSGGVWQLCVYTCACVKPSASPHLESTPRRSRNPPSLGTVPFQWPSDLRPLGSYHPAQSTNK